MRWVLCTAREAAADGELTADMRRQACGQMRTLEARGRSLDTQLHEVTEELYATHAEVRASTVSTHYQRCR